MAVLVKTSRSSPSTRACCITTRSRRDVNDLPRTPPSSCPYTLRVCTYIYTCTRISDLRTVRTYIAGTMCCTCTRCSPSCFLSAATLTHPRPHAPRHATHNRRQTRNVHISTGNCYIMYA